MPTEKNRVNITVDPDTHAALSLLAKRRGKSLSNVSVDLIEKALEIEEDLYFSAVSEKRLRESKGKRISHKEAWGIK
ncbi:MAG: hypothetical protein EA369_00070 [Bradymonadales bacterium]|nr:MAG: hypothetical protein EA369_00070 [Bradymonadales bacterium]